MKLVFALVMVYTFIPATGQESSGTGISLLRQCNAAVVTNPQSTYTNGLEMGVCIGLIRGVMDTMQLWEEGRRQGMTEKIDLHGCIPSEVTPRQAVLVVLKYLNAHPEELHKMDTMLINSALRNAFPCKAE